MLKVEHGDAGATVTVAGEITNDLVLDLCDSLNEVFNTYNWSQVELKIASSGGSLHALHYFVDAMVNHRALAATITTRALTHAASAAAVLVSLGDQRLASRTSLLQYHTGRIRVSSADVTADGAAVMKDVLDSADEGLIRSLVERARREQVAIRPGKASLPDFRDGDWPVVARLTGTSNARRQETPKALLTKLRKRVARALDNRTVQPLQRLYAELFALDQPISAALAMELHLIDAIVSPVAPVAMPPEPDAGNAFRVPEWNALFPRGRIDRAVLCRHMLILGESGSGKTVSGIRPVVQALFDDDNRVGCALVVDPKGDIEPTVERLAATTGTELRKLDVSTDERPWILNLMSGPHSIEDDLANDRVLTAAKRVLVRVASLVPKHPARSLDGAPNRSWDPYWEREGAHMAQAALAIALLVLQHRERLFGPQLAVRLGEPGSRVRQVLGEFGRRAGLVVPDSEVERAVTRTREALDGAKEPPEVIRTEFARGVRFSRLYRNEKDCFSSDFDAVRAECPEPASPGAFNAATGELLGQVLDISCRPRSTHEGIDQPPLERMNVLVMAEIAADLMFAWPPSEDGLLRPSLAATVVSELLAKLLGGNEVEELNRRIKAWQCLASGDGPRSHYNSLYGHIGNCFRDFTDPGLSATVFFGCELFYRSVTVGTCRDARVLDFCSAVDDEAGRHVFLVRPQLSRGADTLMVKALKACYFEAVLNSGKRRLKGGEMPLVAYVSDEFHRFVTSDRSHGEQSFLDTCRSFGAFCVFACQSVSSLQHALAQDGGDWESNRAAVSMLQTNTGSKFFFRSTDPESRRYVDELCPNKPGAAKVTEVRPLSTLSAGECYAATADVRFERRQLEPHVVPAPQADAEQPESVPAQPRVPTSGRPTGEVPF